MRDIYKMCRICLGQGSRNIFEQTLGSNLQITRDDLSRIAEKLRFVTMLKINPKENLPQQICDLCIVQLNVSYNFKKLALKNDFQIRNYMIENGMNLSKDDDDPIEATTALEIHQIQHNVIRTNRYRHLLPPEIRRNSTTSSTSGISTMIINGRENDAIQNNSTNNFVHPRPVVRPIQIKVEPVDPDEFKEPSPAMTSSPSNTSEAVSVITVQSSEVPMVSINGLVNNESFNNKTKGSKTPAPLSVKLAKARKEDESKTRQVSNTNRSLRPRTKQTKIAEKSKMISRSKTNLNLRNIKKSSKNIKLTTSVKIQIKKKQVKDIQPKKRGRPRTVNATISNSKKKNKGAGNKRS
ncbi:CLUMA_CG019515, isoform A [Clunio marinus]|uniref:CLUMA_CG019515, isoform A n=1 Tax=Clunio marinus TaxID=568069 RepID=A0A1J1J5L0_9DIPT|nr:CLUMA_CG019515, isoform A [Clunio marinus]